MTKKCFCCDVVLINEPNKDCCDKCYKLIREAKELYLKILDGLITKRARSLISQVKNESKVLSENIDNIQIQSGK